MQLWESTDHLESRGGFKSNGSWGYRDPILEKSERVDRIGVWLGRYGWPLAVCGAIAFLVGFAFGLGV